MTEKNGQEFKYTLATTNTGSSEIGIILYYHKSNHNPLRSGQYSDAAARITARHRQGKSSGMCSTSSVSELSRLALCMPFLSCVFPRCSLAGGVRSGGSHVLGLVRRERLW